MATYRVYKFEYKLFDWLRIDV